MLFWLSCSSHLKDEHECPDLGGLVAFAASTVPRTALYAFTRVQTNIIEKYPACVYIRGMKPWGRFVFIFIAYGIALLHTAVPHQHSQGIEGRTTLFQAGCIANESTSDFLKLILSTDLGYGHLETFNKSSDTSVHVSFAGISTIALLIPFLTFSGIAVCRSAMP